MTFGDQTAVFAHYDTAHAYDSSSSSTVTRQQPREATHECTFCSWKFVYKGALTTHLANMHDIKPDVKTFTCEICSKVLASRQHLKVHLSGVHRVADVTNCFECDFCSKKFKLKRMLKRHLTTVHGGSTTETETQLASTTQGVRTISKQCDAEHGSDVSGKTFTDKAVFDKHTSSAHDDTKADPAKFSCDVCFKVFKRSYLLKSHLSVAHSIGNARTFQCGV